MGCKFASKILATILPFYILSQGFSSNFDKVVDDFAISIYTNAIIGQSSNVILSPLSIQDALTLVYTGSNGQTMTDLARGLNFGTASKGQVSKAFHIFLRSIKKLDPTVITLDIANKIYVMQNYQISNEFRGYACQLYSSVETINFGNSMSAASTINTWVEDNTNNKIHNLISPNMLSAATRLVIVNAIYFKGLWEHKFDKKNTAPGLFYLDDGSSEEVPLMFVKNDFKYGNIDSLDATAIELPYNNSDVSMMILLPNDLLGLSTLESNLINFDLPTIESQMYTQKVEVTIPKFEINFQIDLGNVLNQLGMGIIYTDQADLTSILSDHESLDVSAVVHKAYISVDEDGAEAAAATGVVITDRALPRIFKFIANHPFVFILKKDGDILFMGRLNQPSS